MTDLSNGGTAVKLGDFIQNLTLSNMSHKAKSTKVLFINIKLLMTSDLF